MRAEAELDVVDHIVDQWRVARPDVDISPVEIVGRISRLSRLIDRRLGENFSEHGIDDWMYDMMATLYRRGAPHELPAGALVGQTMVTTGAITNRIDRLEARGFVERAGAADRRKVIVRLTPDGIAMVEQIVDSHLATERSIVDPLTDRQRTQLVATLRQLLRSLGDVVDDG